MKSEQLSNNFYKNLGVENLIKIASNTRTDDDIKIIKKLCKKEDKILDLACGYGRVTIPLAKNGFNIQGIDLAPNLIQEARLTAKKQGLTIKFDIGNMQNLPYNNDTFKGIFCLWSSFGCLLIEKEQIQAIDEVYRILTTNGVAFFEMINGEKKNISENLEINGKGENKRILEDDMKGIKRFEYIHNRITLHNICLKSKFDRFKIGFKNIHKKRRLVLYLYK